VRVALREHSIFGVCRQVYHEAASVFYSQNHFAISWPCCDLLRFTPRCHDACGRYLAEGAEWLVTLGSLLPKLRRLILDTGALCSPEPYYLLKGGVCIEALPLLRVLWNRSWTGRLEFALAHDLTLQRHACEWERMDEYDERKVDTERLTQMFDYLRKDDLNIRRYERVLRHVAVHRKGDKGVVLFRTSRPTICSDTTAHIYYSEHDIDRRASLGHCLQHRQDFALSLAGGIAMLTETPSESLSRQDHIRQQIFDLLLLSAEVVTVNLNNDRNQVPGLLYLNRTLHTREFRRYYMLNSFNLSIDHRIQGSELVDFGALDWWMSCGDFSGRNENMAGLKGQNVRNINFNAHSVGASPLTLDQLRINTGAFLRQGAQLGDSSASVTIRVRITLALTHGSDEGSTEVTFSLYTLRFKALRVVRKLHEADIGLEKDDEVEIVVDGHGMPVGYVFPGLSEVHQFPW
jgi:hypothetical protein